MMEILYELNEFYAELSDWADKKVFFLSTVIEAQH
jgi:hypothetical protein